MNLVKPSVASFQLFGLARKVGSQQGGVLDNVKVGNSTFETGFKTNLEAPDQIVARRFTLAAGATMTLDLTDFKVSASSSGTPAVEATAHCDPEGEDVDLGRIYGLAIAAESNVVGAAEEYRLLVTSANWPTTRVIDTFVDTDSSGFMGAWRDGLTVPANAQLLINNPSATDITFSITAEGLRNSTIASVEPSEFNRFNPGTNVDFSVENGFSTGLATRNGHHFIISGAAAGNPLTIQAIDEVTGVRRNTITVPAPAVNRDWQGAAHAQLTMNTVRITGSDANTNGHYYEHEEDQRWVNVDSNYEIRDFLGNWAIYAGPGGSPLYLSTLPSSADPVGHYTAAGAASDTDGCDGVSDTRETEYLYIADMINAGDALNTVEIYRINNVFNVEKESRVADRTLNQYDIQTISLDVSGITGRSSSAIVVDPATGDIYFYTNTATGEAYRVPHRQAYTGAAAIVPELVATAIPGTNSNIWAAAANAAGDEIFVLCDPGDDLFRNHRKEPLTSSTFREMVAGSARAFTADPGYPGNGTLPAQPQSANALSFKDDLDTRLYIGSGLSGANQPNFIFSTERHDGKVVNLATFQEGVGAYAGTLDTYIDSLQPNVNFGADPLLKMLSDASTEQSLLKFDLIFGAGAGQVPDGSTIAAAWLDLTLTSAAGSGFQVYQMRQAFDAATNTWANYAGGQGVDPNGVEAGVTPLGVIGEDIALSAIARTDIRIMLDPAIIEAWRTSNHGLFLRGVGKTGGVEAHSSAAATANDRPKLSIVYLT